MNFKCISQERSGDQYKLENDSSNYGQQEIPVFEESDLENGFGFTSHGQRVEEL